MKPPPTVAVVRLALFLEVVTGTEGTARATHEDDSQLGISVQRIEGTMQLGDARACEGVAAFGAIQNQLTDGVADLGQNQRGGVVCHSGTVDGGSVLGEGSRN